MILTTLIAIISIELVDCAMYRGIDKYQAFYNLPPLPFKFGGMEPQFDAATMKIHYIEVHANFTVNMNRLLKEWRTEVSSHHYDLHVFLLEPR